MADACAAFRGDLDALIGRTVTAGTQKPHLPRRGDGSKAISSSLHRQQQALCRRGRPAQRRTRVRLSGRHITETPVQALPWLAVPRSRVLAAFSRSGKLRLGEGVPAIGNEAVSTKVTTSPVRSSRCPTASRSLESGAPGAAACGLNDHGEVPRRATPCYRIRAPGAASFEHKGSGDLRPRGVVSVRHQVR
jgi:hypothetical protein